MSNEKISPSTLGGMSRKAALLVLAGIVVGGLVTHWLLTSSAKAPQTVTKVDDGVTVPSRLWMEYAEDIVRQTKPTPPLSARLYAFVGTAYSETLETTGSSEEAGKVTADILNVLAPEYEATTTLKLVELGKADTVLSSAAQEVKVELIGRVKTDGAGEVWDGTRPSGEEYWVGDTPFSPLAGTWKRWVVLSSDDLSVPPPPEWGSEAHTNALAEVKKAAAERTPQQSAAINFWGGVPGTVAPAGIWQDRLFNETKEYTLTDKEYAQAQMALAQTVADTFLECWKIKYQYWTSRPSMDDKTIDLAMPNPPFPSYTSGHSSISRAAAEVLSALFPEKRDIWMRDATEAKNSRLWAGIHFSYDNDAGFALGEKVGQVMVRRLAVEELR